MLRANISVILQDFAASYRQAMAFQNSYSIVPSFLPHHPQDGGASRFSVYPFPPLPTDIASVFLFCVSYSQPLVQGPSKSDLRLFPPSDLTLPPFTSTPILAQPSPTASDRPSLSLFQPPQPPLPQDFPVSQEPPLQPQLQPRLSSQLNPPLNPPMGLESAAPAENAESLLPLDGAPQLLDSQMDSQIALHQEVLFQNDFVLRRTNGEQSQAEEAGLPLNLDGMPPPSFSAGDEDFSISALLSGPTVGEMAMVHD